MSLAARLLFVVVVLVALVAGVTSGRSAQPSKSVAPSSTAGSSTPRIWDDTALADWATPVAALGVRPAHVPASDYYAVPEDNYQTYPVYHPDREPPGYWEWLQKQPPAKLVDASRVHADGGWIAQGERAFRDLDAPRARIADPKILARARDPKAFEGVLTLADGTVHEPRWVVTDKGLMLTRRECSRCHFRLTADRRVEYGGALVVPDEPVMPAFAAQMGRDAITNTYPGEPLGAVVRRLFATPWHPDPRVEALRTATSREIDLLLAPRHSVVARPHGSPFYGAKAPDLRVTRYNRYLGATGTHRLRGPEDVARWAAFVAGADPMTFGEHQILTEAQRRMSFRYADEVLYAVGRYVMALDPPRNPNPPPRALVVQGQRVFTAQMCAKCHAPPTYTTGRLTPATGFTPPASHTSRADVTNVGVDTDPGLALETRKGTGFYRIPSLLGVWTRPYLLHDASVASLDELFDAARLANDYEPRGWNPPGVQRRSVPGHAFGLTLPAAEKAALLAFLRSL